HRATRLVGLPVDEEVVGVTGRHRIGGLHEGRVRGVRAGEAARLLPRNQARSARVDRHEDRYVLVEPGGGGPQVDVRADDGAAVDRRRDVDLEIGGVDGDESGPI